MTSFGPVPEHLLNQPRRFPMRYFPTEEGNRSVRHRLRLINEQSSFHDRPYTWGFTIFRTVYTPESDETFPKAIERLYHAANDFVKAELSLQPAINQDPLDPAPNEEMARRFYCDIVVDAENLDGASPDDIGTHFDAWVQEHLHLQGQNGFKSGRYCFCIMIDQQGIDHLLQLCNREEWQDRYLDQYNLYVKVITEKADWREEVGERFWMRVGVVNYLFSLAFGWDPDLDISEMGIPDPMDGVYNMYGQDAFKVSRPD